MSRPRNVLACNVLRSIDGSLRLAVLLLCAPAGIARARRSGPPLDPAQAAMLHGNRLACDSTTSLRRHERALSTDAEIQEHPWARAGMLAITT